MSRGKHRKLHKIGRKLLAIRLHAGLTQKEILRFINDDDDMGNRSIISHFERGKSEPSLFQILKYAELATKHSKKNLRVEDLIDDEKELDF